MLLPKSAVFGDSLLQTVLGAQSYRLSALQAWPVWFRLEDRRAGGPSLLCSDLHQLTQCCSPGRSVPRSPHCPSAFVETPETTLCVGSLSGLQDNSYQRESPRTAAGPSIRVLPVCHTLPTQAGDTLALTMCNRASWGWGITFCLSQGPPEEQNQ